MKVLNIYLHSSEEFRSDYNTTVFKDWGIECYAQDPSKEGLIEHHRRLYIPWDNIKMIEEIVAGS